MDYREEAIECVKDCVLPIHQQIYAKYGGDFDRIYSEGYNSKSYQGRVIEPGNVSVPGKAYYSFFRSLNLTVGSMSGLRIRYSEEANDALSGSQDMPAWTSSIIS